MENLRDILKAILIMFIINIILYINIIVLTLEFNPLLWDIIYRQVVVFINGVVIGSCVCFHILD